MECCASFNSFNKTYNLKKQTNTINKTYQGRKKKIQTVIKP